MSGLRKLLPSANSLLIFEAAARTLSFKASAAELCVTQPSVSHAIKALEDHLGLKLFDRGNRGVRLTAVGAEIYAEVGPALHQIECRLRSVSERESHTLTIAASTSVAAQWLLPITSAFQRAYPDMKIKLMTTDRNVEPGSEVDLTIRRGPLNWQRQNCWHITDEVLYPICSASYLENAPQLNNLDDLKQHSIIHNSEPFRNRMGWQEWLNRLEYREDLLPETLVLNDYQLVLQACIAGEGVAMGWSITSHDMVKQKILLRPLPHTVR
ncbi:MAG: LysR family transcriptional regulator, partial [Gammaproteobacteria bacterium]|nr:LysR family transcriptional regulator [Gammaproteobacteria bacterium]